MKIRSLIIGATAGGCALGALAPAKLSAAPSDEAFNALSDMVAKQGQMIQELMKTHQQDQQQIQDLKQQVSQTQELATNAVEKAEAAAQPVFPTPNPPAKMTHNFMVVGDAETQFGKSASQNPTFVMADFAPIFLFRANQDTLFEAGFDVMLANNFNPDGTRAAGSTTQVSLSFAQLDYTLNDYLTLVAGDILLPLGTYSERGAGWLNKIPDGPLVRDFLPGSAIGVQLRGALPIGTDGQSLNYAVYGNNGPSSSSPIGTANAAQLDLAGNVGSTPNWHANPSGGGRIGWFYPWGLHKDIEIGLSGQTGQWSDTGSHFWSAAVLDAALHWGPYFELKGEYINTWFGTDDLGTITPHGVWVQGSYKLAGVKRDLSFLKNVELVARYDNEDDGQGTRTDRYTAGFVYYFSNTLLFEGDYEFLDSHGPNALPPTMWVLQLSYGF
ncbi:MAG TPA: hypothetical protein VF988_03850 [Verrucomicrobiae bacterium]